MRSYNHLGSFSMSIMSILEARSLKAHSIRSRYCEMILHSGFDVNHPLQAINNAIVLCSCTYILVQLRSDYWRLCGATSVRNIDE